jgi:hypothetical protein
VRSSRQKGSRSSESRFLRVAEFLQSRRENARELRGKLASSRDMVSLTAASVCQGEGIGIRMLVVARGVMGAQAHLGTVKGERMKPLCTTTT